MTYKKKSRDCISWIKRRIGDYFYMPATIMVV